MKQMRFAVILLLFTLLLAGTVQAQADLSVNTVQVQLWPEYDQPAMLVIYTLELGTDQTLPAEVTVRIPAAVGDPLAVAVLEGDSLVTRQYTRTVDGDWADITLEADYSVIQIEYYDSALNQNNPERSYTFSWESEYPVDNFVISLKEPLNAQDFNVLPSLGTGQAGADGLLTYANNFGSLAANQAFNLTLGYTKNDNLLAVDNIVQSSSSATNTAAASEEPIPVWVWVLAGAGVLVLAVGGVLYYRSQQQAAVSKYQTRKKRVASSKPAAGSVFCHNCGARAAAGDKFCRECGTRLRG